MKRIIMLFAGLFLFTDMNVKAQCACCSSVGCGDNSGGSSSLVKKGKVLFSLVGRYTSFKPMSSNTLVNDANADTSFSVYNKSYQMTYTFSLTYGISNRFNATVTLPYSLITNIQTALPGSSGADVLGTSQGLSNIKTSLQFVLLQKQLFNGWEAIPSIGLIAPTGIHNNVAKDGTFFDDQFQPGANAWVPVLGLVADKMFGKKTLRLTGAYVFQDTDPQGNVDAALWNVEASMYFPLTKTTCTMKAGDSITTCTAQSMQKVLFSAFGGLQLEHVGQDIVAMPDGSKVPNPNIGAVRSYASIGVVANVNRRLFIPISVAVPFYQHENGYQVTVNYRLNVGLSFLL